MIQRQSKSQSQKVEGPSGPGRGIIARGQAASWSPSLLVSLSPLLPCSSSPLLSGTIPHSPSYLCPFASSLFPFPLPRARLKKSPPIPNKHRGGGPRCHPNSPRLTATGSFSAMDIARAARETPGRCPCKTAAITGRPAPGTLGSPGAGCLFPDTAPGREGFLPSGLVRTVPPALSIRPADPRPHHCRFHTIWA